MLLQKQRESPVAAGFMAFDGRELQIRRVRAVGAARPPRAAEQYAAQLHEIDRVEYLSMKHHELARAATKTIELQEK